MPTLKLAIHQKGFNIKYIQITGHSRFLIQPKSYGLNFEAGAGKQLYNSHCDWMEIINEFPTYARPEIVEFPLK